LVTFWALRRRSGANSEAGREAAKGRMPGVMPKSNRLAAGETKLCTSKKQERAKELDSGFRRNDGQKERSQSRSKASARPAGQNFLPTWSNAM
jgi:hypothetical protein